MKKFALLGAVAALATAGGVFAAWNFNNSTDIQDKEASLIAGEVTGNVTYVGVGELTVTSDLHIVVTPKENATANVNTYTVALQGSIEIEYSANAETADDFEDQGATVDVTGVSKDCNVTGYDKAFTIALNDFTPVSLTDGQKVTLDADDFTISNTDDVIESYEEYLAFVSAVTTFTYSVSVTA